MGVFVIFLKAIYSQRSEDFADHKRRTFMGKGGKFLMSRAHIMEEQLNFAAWANGNKWGDFAGSIVVIYHLS